MKITNKNGFGKAWANAVEKFLNDYDPQGDISVTEMIDSPRIAELRRRHADEIEVDVKDCIWMMLGQVIHKILETNADPDTIVEQRIVVPFEDWKISMKADYIEKTSPTDYCIHDYKITKVYAFQKAPAPQHIAQNNLYRWGYKRAANLNCTSGCLDMLLKDWDALQAKIDKGYPKDEVVRVAVPDWTQEKIEAFMRERIAKHKHARSCSDCDLPECTIDQRWGSPDCFAVKRIDPETGRLSDKAMPGASKFPTRNEAQQWIASKKTNHQYVIEFRKGENRRCDRNACWVNRWCNQYIKINPDF